MSYPKYLVLQSDALKNYNMSWDQCHCSGTLPKMEPPNVFIFDPSDLFTQVIFPVPLIISGLLQ